MKLKKIVIFLFTIILIAFLTAEDSHTRRRYHKKSYKKKSSLVGKKVQFHSTKFLENKSIKYLRLHRAKIYACSGYIFTDKYLSDYVYNLSFYKPKAAMTYTKMVRLMTDKEHKYLRKLNGIISDKMKIFKNKQISKLKELLGIDISIIQTFQLDINYDGYYELIVLLKKYFPFKLRAYHPFYKEKNNYYVAVINTDVEPNIRMVYDVNDNNVETGEFVQDLQADYFVGNNFRQIKIIRHSITLNQKGEYPLHEEKVILISIKDNRPKVIFDHPIYYRKNEGNIEKIMKYDIFFKNKVGNSINEIVLKKKNINRKYSDNIYKTNNYDDKITYGTTIVFQYDKDLEIYSRIK